MIVKLVRKESLKLKAFWVIVTFDTSGIRAHWCYRMIAIQSLEVKDYSATQSSIFHESLEKKWFEMKGEYGQKGVRSKS